MCGTIKQYYYVLLMKCTVQPEENTAINTKNRQWSKRRKRRKGNGKKKESKERKEHGKE
jgi:hypothetical protein